MEDDLDINDIKLSEKTEDDNEEEKEEEEEEEEDENSEGREYSYVRGRCRPSVRTREASISPDPNEEKNENEDEEYMYDSDPDYANLFQDVDDNVDQVQDYMNVNQPIKLRDHRRSASVGSDDKDGLKVKRTSRPLSNYLNVAPLPEPVSQVEDATKTTDPSTVNTTTSEQSEDDSPKSSSHRIKPKYRAPARPPPGFKKLPPVDTSLGDVTAMKKSVSSGTGLTRNRPALKKTVSVPHTSSDQKTSAPSKPPRARPNPSSEQLESRSSPLLSTSQNYQLSKQRKKSTGELQKPDDKTSSTRQTSHPIPSKKVPPPSVVARKPPEHRKTSDVSRKKNNFTPPSTKKDLTPPSTKKDLTPPSTKKDLTPPSTKKDLTPPSTKKDPTPPSAKKDLTPPSTKKDLTPPSAKKDLTPPSTKKSSEPELLNQIKQGDTPKSSPSSGRKAVRVAPPPPKPLSSPLLREGPQEGKIGDEKLKMVSEEKPELPPPPLPPKGVSVSKDDAIDKSKVVSKHKRRNEQQEETRDEDKETDSDSVVSENAMKVLNAMKQTVSNVKSVSATLSEV